MADYTDKIRKWAKDLLSEKKVDAVIGFKEGTVPLMAEPCIIRRPKDADKLVFNSFCGVNLANYVTKRQDNLGVTVKGCDSRNLATHIVENQIKRDQLNILGLPCMGMVDRRKVAAAVDHKEITSAADEGDTIKVEGPGFSEAISKKDVLQDNCAICIHRNPVIHDELAGDLVEEQKDVDRYTDVKNVEAMGPEERWQYFEDLISGCIRCYACRNACPLCYCPTCFVDESKPQWVGKSIDPTDTRTFHFLRAFHCAGRCTDCGACERACPMGIKVRQFTKKLEKDCLELYGWEAGLDPNVRPPLDTYRLEDPEEFIN